MKKSLLFLLSLMIFFMAGCQNNQTNKNATDQKTSEQTRIYHAENGDIKVPTHPKRVVVLSGFTGNVLKLGVPVVGAESWSKNAPYLSKQLKDAKEVSEDDLEGIIALNPDLIIALSTVKNLNKLQKIAPTVVYTWGKLDYLDQHIEIGKLLNKEKQATDWVNTFKKDAEQTGQAIRQKIGENATVSVIEAYGKDLYVYGDNWARGTELLYQTMKLNMPEKVKADALKNGYFALSTEVLPEYMGDYVILSKYHEADLSFEQTATYQNIPAVKNHHVFTMQGEGASFNDPITLEKQLAFFKKSFLG